MKQPSLTCLVMFAASVLFAQKNPLYDVYLKNGTMVRGEITELTTGQVKIRFGEGVISELDMNDVEKVVPHVQTAGEKTKRPPVMPAKGFFNETELGALVGSGTDGDKFHTAWTLQNVSGYRINRYLKPGGGAGFDYYPEYDNTFISLFGRVSGDMIPYRVTPVYFADAGYGFITGSGDYTNGMEQQSSKGGLMVHGGLGVRFYTASKLSVSLLVGFKMQRSEREYVNTWNETYVYSEERTFLRHTFRLGLCF